MSTWTPKPEDIAQVLREQNPWLESGRVPEALAPPTERPLARLLLETVTRDEPLRYQLVLGPRRVGKTTAMYQTVRALLSWGIAPTRVVWYRLDHPFLLPIPLGVLLRTVLTTVNSALLPLYVFLDELVYGEDWDIWLKTFYDESWPVRIVGSSSATAALRRRRLESGVGRWEEQYMLPYLITEYLDLIGESSEVEVGDSLAVTLSLMPEAPSWRDLRAHRERLLVVGGFPELLRRSDDRDEITAMIESQRTLRSDAVERAVYKDIPQSFRVDNPMVLERLLYVLAGQVTGLLSPTNICRDLDGLSQPTFDRYLSYLERAFLVFTLPNYSGTEAAVQKRGRKVYFLDGAVRNAALQRGLAPLADPVEMGLLLENMAAGHLHALAIQSQVRLFHWRDGRHEVDLVYDHPTDPVAFEIGRGARHSTSGLQRLMERHPRLRGRCYVVAPSAPLVSPARSSSGVGSLPFDAFLLAVGRQAEHAMQRRLA